jgi:hypothetical protein
MKVIKQPPKVICFGKNDFLLSNCLRSIVTHSRYHPLYKNFKNIIIQNISEQTVMMLNTTNRQHFEKNKDKKIKLHD